MENGTTDDLEVQKDRAPERTVWLLPVYIFVLNLVLGVTRASGIIYVAIIEAEQFTRREASWPGSFNGAVSILFGPVVGILSARWAPHQMTLCGVSLYAIGYSACFFSTNLYVLIIFYGVFRGCGMTMTMLTLPVVVNTVFKENRALAMGLGGSGFSVAGFIWPYVVRLLLESYGLNGTLLLLGGISVHGLISASGLLAYNVHSEHYRDKPEDVVDELGHDASKQKRSYSACFSKNEQAAKNGSSEDQKQKQLLLSSPEQEVKFKTDENFSPETKERKPRYFNPRIIKNIFTCRGFYLLLVTRIVTIYFLASYSDLHIDYLRDKGIPVADSVHMILVYSVGSLVGLVCLSWITDKKFLSRQFYTAGNYVLSGMTILLLTCTNSFVVCITCAFVLGLLQGSSFAVSDVMVADYMRKDEMPLAFASIRSINGLVTLGRAPVIGYFRDVLGTYDPLFRILGGALTFASLMWFVEGVIVFKNKRRSKMKDGTAASNQDGTKF